VLEQQPILLSTLPPSRGQERVALVAALLLLAVFLVTVPFAHVQLGRIDGFIPIVATVMFLNDTITSALLFAQFAVLRSRPLLVLASGFLFTGLLMLPQSTGSLFISWQFGLPAITIVYALLKDAERERPMAPGSVRIAADVGPRTRSLRQRRHCESKYYQDQPQGCRRFRSGDHSRHSRYDRVARNRDQVCDQAERSCQRTGRARPAQDGHRTEHYYTGGPPAWAR